MRLPENTRRLLALAATCALGLMPISASAYIVVIDKEGMPVDRLPDGSPYPRILSEDHPVVKAIRQRMEKIKPPPPPPPPEPPKEPIPPVEEK